MTTREKLIKYLTENTMYTSVYTGGGDEDSYLALTESEGVLPATKEETIAMLAESILNAIE